MINLVRKNIPDPRQISLFDFEEIERINNAYKEKQANKLKKGGKNEATKNRPEAEKPVE